MTPRQRELAARHLLTHLDQIPICLKQRRWEELAAVVEFVGKDIPSNLAQTDPALYQLLRQQITEYHLRGWTCLSFGALQALTKHCQSPQTSPATNPPAPTRCSAIPPRK